MIQPHDPGSSEEALFEYFQLQIDVDHTRVETRSLAKLTGVMGSLGLAMAAAGDQLQQVENLAGKMSGWGLIWSGALTITAAGASGVAAVYDYNEYRRGLRFIHEIAQIDSKVE